MKPKGGIVNESADPWAAGAAAANALVSGEPPATIMAAEGTVPYETDIAALTGVNQKMLRNSTTCKEFQNGLCNRGNSCKFSHGPYPMGGGPTQGGVIGGLQPAMGATMCFDFKMGRCERAAACRFSHGDAPPQAPPVASPFPEQVPVGVAGGVCLDFHKGLCNRGAQCKFSHGGVPQAPTGAGMPLAPTWGGERIS